MPLSVTSANIAITQILLKTRFFEKYAFVADSIGLAATSLTYLTQLAFKCDAFSVITRNNGHYGVKVIQGHRFVIIESSYATSY